MLWPVLCVLIVFFLVVVYLMAYETGKKNLYFMLKMHALRRKHIFYVEHVQCVTHMSYWLGKFISGYGSQRNLLLHTRRRKKIIFLNVRIVLCGSSLHSPYLTCKENITMTEMTHFVLFLVALSCNVHFVIFRNKKINIGIWLHSVRGCAKILVNNEYRTSHVMFTKNSHSDFQVAFIDSSISHYTTTGQR